MKCAPVVLVLGLGFADGCGHPSPERESGDPILVYHPPPVPILAFDSMSPAAPLDNQYFTVRVRLTNLTSSAIGGYITAAIDGATLIAQAGDQVNLAAGQTTYATFWTYGQYAGPHTLTGTYEMQTGTIYNGWSGKLTPIYSVSATFQQAIQVLGGRPGPKYNEVHRTATHNSYWVDRDNTTEIADIAASGVQQRILDQLIFEHARALEIDVHRDDTTPRNWTVYHTALQSNSFCSPLSECLKQLQLFHRALPNHEVVTIVLELKEIFEQNFDDTHTPADLDAIIEQYLGPMLYRPRDFLARCAPGTRIDDCAKIAGWPSTAELRGKFIFAVIGNWHYDLPLLGWVGHGGEGWVRYATWGTGAKDRTGFPMASNWVRFNGGPETEIVDPSLVEEARHASLFLQAEDSAGGSLTNRGLWAYSAVDGSDNSANDPGITGFLASGGLVRGADSPDLWDQRDRLSRGFQFLQTDHPWLRVDNGGVSRPFLPLPAVASTYSDPTLFEEPGSRLFMLDVNPPEDSTQLYFAHRDASASTNVTWSALPSSTRFATDDARPNPRRPLGKGCLRAAASLDASGDSITLCRQTAQGAWNVSKPLEQDAIITVETVLGGVHAVQTFYSDADRAIGPGDMLRLDVSMPSNGSSCASAFSASALDLAGNVDWGSALVTFCSPNKLSQQGLAASFGDVLFADVEEIADGAPVLMISASMLSDPEPVLASGQSLPGASAHAYMLKDESGPALRCNSAAPQGRAFTANGACVVPVYRGKGWNGAGSVYSTDPVDASAWDYVIDPADTFYVLPRVSTMGFNFIPPSLTWLEGCPRPFIDPFWLKDIDRIQMRASTSICASQVSLGLIDVSAASDTIPLYSALSYAGEADEGRFFTIDPTEQPDPSLVQTIGWVWPASAVHR